MAKITIHWGDGFICIIPTFPERLLKELRYWHRSLDYTPALNKMVASGEYRKLFKITDHLDEKSNQVSRRLVTMPGFLHKIKTILTEEGYDYVIKDERTPSPTADIYNAMKGLKDFQIEAAYKAIMSGGGIISAPTGWGKTFLLAAIINAYSHKELCARNTPLAVVATPAKDITRKDADDLVTLLPDHDVGLIMSGTKKFSDDVQVITLNSLHLLNPEDIGILIIDEVHTSASEKRTETILAARKALKWGVSATPTGRFDGRDLVTEGLFGPVVYQCTYADGIASGALVPITVYWINVPEPPMGIDKYLRFKTRAGKYRNGVDRNDNQNKLIAELLKRIPESYQTMAIMPHLDQLNHLAILIPKVATIHGESSQQSLERKNYHNLTSVSSKERKETYRKMAAGELRKIMCTQIYQEGVNFPQLEIVVNAGGGGSDIVAKQIPGRESRNIEGKDESFLIDFNHPWDVGRDKHGHSRPGPILKDDNSREKSYSGLGFKQIWLDKIDDLPFLGV